jgi:hypothetical protein
MHRATFGVLLVLCCVLFSHPVRGSRDAAAGGRARVKPSAASVVRNPTFHHEVQGFPLSLSPGEMEALLDDLPHASSLLRKYGIHTLTVTRDGEAYAAYDGKGIEGTFVLLFRDGAYRQYAGEGVIEKSIAGRISAEVVASISYTPAGDRFITNDLEFWVLVNNPVLDFLCRLFKPMVRGVLENNVEFLVHTVQRLAVAVRASGGADIPLPRDG